jgi:hypothetical protein
LFSLVAFDHILERGGIDAGNGCLDDLSRSQLAPETDRRAIQVVDADNKRQYLESVDDIPQLMICPRRLPSVFDHTTD